MQLSAYKIDKLRAKTSDKALDSVFTRIHGIFERNKEIQDRLTTNVLLFSMGAYTFKHVVDQSFLTTGGDREADSSVKIINEVANNILMVAADVNNPGHEDWCDKLSPTRGSAYVTINESDLALSLSEMLFAGPEQMARLGNSNFNLKSRKVTYLNVSSSSHLGNMHRYFEGNQPVLKDVFSIIFKGKNPLEDRSITLLSRDDSPQAYNLRYCPYC
ncbi:MAG: esterase/lipase superfamily enzyme [Chlamydiales bacterium]|jgi:esterase/lipase superfamily enzyme